MSVVVSSVLPFPNICWWSIVYSSGEVHFDLSEHFEKMSYRNRYYITGANGLITLSIPLVSGREQRKPMNEVLIDNRNKWQVQHWRTLVSVYKRAPYFEHYEPSMQTLFEQEFEKLVDFNMASILWLRNHLKAEFSEQLIEVYKKEYLAASDIRKSFRPVVEKRPLQQQPYYQMFVERNGFLPNLSMLDLLFTEGPYAMQWLRSNISVVEQWYSGK